MKISFTTLTPRRLDILDMIARYITDMKLAAYTNYDQYGPQIIIPRDIDRIMLNNSLISEYGAYIDFAYCEVYSLEFSSLEDYTKFVLIWSE